MRLHVLPALTASVLAIATTAALAADLPSRRAPPEYIPPPIPAFSWTGFFIGGNAGANFNDGRAGRFFFPAGSIAGSTGTAGTLSTGGSRSSTGFTGGGQIGYNYELGGAGLGGLGGLTGGGLVIGAVADAQYLDQKNRFDNTYTFAPTSPLTAGNAFVRVPGLARTNLVTTGPKSDEFFGTLRGRLGVAFDRVMLYGTGGFAYNSHATGYTYGGGLEYSITNNISIGAEYLRVNLGGGNGYAATYTPGAGLGAGTLTLNTTGGRDEFNVARGVLNYRFTSPVVPVVARY